MWILQEIERNLHSYKHYSLTTFNGKSQRIVLKSRGCVLSDVIYNVFDTLKIKRHSTASIKGSVCSQLVSFLLSDSCLETILPPSYQFWSSLLRIVLFKINFNYPSHYSRMMHNQDTLVLVKSKNVQVSETIDVTDQDAVYKQHSCS